MSSDNLGNYSRQQLYELVWSEPMMRLAQRFDLSDVAVAKHCRRLNVPVPERGYWAKRQAGKPVVQTPLPPREPGQLDESVLKAGTWSMHDLADEALTQAVSRPPSFPETLADLAIRIRQQVGQVTVPKTLSRPHREIARLLKRDDKRREQHAQSSHQFLWDGPLFDSPFERRRLRVLNAVFMALTNCGTTPSLRGREARELDVLVGSTRVSFTLDRPDAPDRSTRQFVFEKPKTLPDKLLLIVKPWPAVVGVPLVWIENDNATLEAQIGEIVVGLIVIGEAQLREHTLQHYQSMIKEKADREEAARQHKEETERRERERQIRLERERVERLLAEALALRQATDIRAYVDAVLRTNTSATTPVSQTEVDAWAAWALAQADRVDPVLSGRFLVNMGSEAD